MTGTVVDRPESPRIDDRIRARRIEVRRSEGRRRLHRLLGVLLVSAVVLAGWAVVRSPLLDVDEITVTGTDRTAPDEVLDVLGISRGDALVDVDVDAAAEAVSALPWVARVDVVRSWGGSVEVTVGERTPAAIATGPDGASWLVDGTGSVLGPTSDVGGAPSSDLVEIQGITPPPPGGVLDASNAPALELATTLPETVRPLVAAVEITDAGEVRLRLHPRPGELDAAGRARDDGGFVELGDGREVSEQVRSLTLMLDQVDLTDLVRLDVRVPSNPVVTRTPVPLDDDDATDGVG